MEVEQTRGRIDLDSHPSLFFSVLSLIFLLCDWKSFYPSRNVATISRIVRTVGRNGKEPEVIGPRSLGVV